METETPLQDIVVVGSGNLAEALARAVAAAPDLRLRQLFARNAERGAAVAALAATEWCSDAARLAPADLYLIAVSDRAVGEVAAALPIPAGAFVAHTAGSVPLDEIPSKYGRRGVFYPLQTFTRGRAVDFARIPLFIEGSDERAARQLEAFARRLSRTVLRADSAQRRAIHLAGVFACNFANAMYTAAGEVLREAGLPFDVLKPLILETAAKAADAPSPAAVQTGPAMRGDAPTLARHRAMLAAEPDLEAIYRKLSHYIWETSKKI